MPRAHRLAILLALAVGAACASVSVEVDYDPEEDFSVEVVGNWAYVAWEAPNAKSSAGRLWISDDAGLRGYEP